MSKRIEKISAFLDNDMHRDELMSFSLSAEDDDAKVAQRYQLMGDVLRGEMSESSFVDVSSAVREALADENIADEMPHAASQVHSLATSSATNNTPVNDASSAGWIDFSSWFRPVAGMAMAALVAVVVVVSVSTEDASVGVPVAVKTESQPGVQPVVQVAVEAQPAKSGQQINQHRVNQHLEFATQDTLQGRLPYVRAVSFEAEK